MFKVYRIPMILHQTIYNRLLFFRLSLFFRQTLRLLYRGFRYKEAARETTDRRSVPTDS